MKKFLLGIATVSILLAVVVVAGKTSVGAAPETNPINDPFADLGPDHEIYKAGLWRDGKAVFSDWKFMDILWKKPFQRGYRPTQPIAYSHKLHMEKNGMECQYCHSGVTKSAFATIPSVQLCMGCHSGIKTDTPGIKQLASYWDNGKGKPIPWEPVNNLPEHVRFNHKRHLKAGVGCQNCHGQVQKMAVVEKVSSLKMGFCVSCHREKGASIDCAACHY